MGRFASMRTGVSHTQNAFHYVVWKPSKAQPLASWLTSIGNDLDDDDWHSLHFMSLKVLWSNRWLHLTD